ncbi:hypothetical protein PG994_002535 [Apiospora phragmitis]|uniref:Uncharacterized protein n=1 Tax=Apiospora phragmitis TaxID=2905665 RepID=A0ABR1W5J9_9PEZI
MQFLTILPFLSVLAGSATAFTFPQGQIDGNYRAYVDSNATEVHVNLDTGAVYTIPAAQRAKPLLEAAAPVDKRQTDAGGGGDMPHNKWHCGCGFNLNHGDCDAAVADMEHQLGDGYPGAAIDEHMSYYSIRGSVVAFVCAYSVGFGYHGSDFANAAAGITGRCGWYIAGTMTTAIEGGNVGYMRYSPGLDFCRNADTAQATHC